MTIQSLFILGHIIKKIWSTGLTSVVRDKYKSLFITLHYIICIWNVLIIITDTLFVSPYSISLLTISCFIRPVKWKIRKSVPAWNWMFVPIKPKNKWEYFLHLLNIFCQISWEVFQCYHRKYRRTKCPKFLNQILANIRNITVCSWIHPRT
jgi:hypothetical protein